MNKFEQRVRNLVPELGDILLQTGNSFDIALHYRRLLKESNMSTDNDLYFMVVLTGVYAFKTIEGLIAINCSQDISDILNDEQLRGAVLHELGHIKRGDLEGSVNRVEDNEDNEIAADRFALDHGVKAIDLLNAVSTLTIYGVNQLTAWKKIVDNCTKVRKAEKGIQAALDQLPRLMGKRYEALINS